ncbi:MAG: 5-(carboxyamino)imidazole ribonucleotide mutase [Chloroflexota bacterium]|nr:5-(carboxyamino)imidazole ribonucleotide mutase [Chloroflexota bacterium]
MPSPLVSVICGSRSDLEAVEKGVAVLTDLAIPYELRIISAHRAPALLERYVQAADDRGVRVFICAAGLAAHLAGAVAARTSWPVIGLPMPGGVGGGLDALLSTVQMPPGVPVATVGLGNSRNAALLASQILAISDTALAERVVAFRAAQTRAVEDDPLNEGL